MSLGVIPVPNGIVSNQEFTIIGSINNGDVVGEVEAYLPNIETFGYNIISGNSNEAFSIDTENGELTINNRQNLSFDSPLEIDLEIELSDGTSSYTDIVTIYLNAKPTITFDQTNFVFDASENWNIPFTVMDPDDDTFTIDFYTTNKYGVTIEGDEDDPSLFYLTPPAEGFQYEVDEIRLQLLVKDKYDNIVYSEPVEILLEGIWGETDLWSESNIVFNQMLINQNYNGDQTRPAVDLNDQGDMAIAWADDAAWILYVKSQLSGEQDMKIHQIYDAHSDPSTGRVNTGIDIELNEVQQFGISWQIGRLIKAKRYDLNSEEILEVSNLEKYVDRGNSIDTKIAIDNNGAMLVGYQWLSGSNKWTGQLDFVSSGGTTYPNSFDSENAFLFEMDANTNREGFLINGNNLMSFKPGSSINTTSFAPGDSYSTIAYLDDDTFLLASSSEDYISIQKYTADGSPAFEQPIVVTVNVASYSPKPKLAVDGQGNFAILCSVVDSGLVVKRYNSEGVYIQTFLISERDVDSFDFSMNNSGEFVVVWSDDLYDFREEYDIEVYATRVNPQLNTFEFSLGENIYACEGDVIELEIPENYASYLWTTQENTASIEVTKTGTYGVTLTSIYGGTAYDEIEVIFSSSNIDLGDNLTTCEEEILIDAGTEFDSYLWSNGETTQSITVSTSSIYKVTATNKDGCIVSDEIEVVFMLPPTIELGSDIDDCANEYTLDAGSGFIEYLWDSGETAQTISVNESGTYGVTVTDTNGCTAYDNIELNCILKVTETHAEGIEIFPNPTRNFVSIKVLRPYEEMHLTIYNIHGIEYMSNTLTQLSENSTRTLNVSHLPNGIYVLFINGSFSSKLIVDK